MEIERTVRERENFLENTCIVSGRERTRDEFEEREEKEQENEVRERVEQVHVSVNQPQIIYIVS